MHRGQDICFDTTCFAVSPNMNTAMNWEINKCREKNCYFQHHNYWLLNNYSISVQVGYGMVDSQGRPQGWVGHNHLIFISSTSKITVLLTLYHTNISMHILHTVLHTFPKRLARRICLTIKSCFCWWSSTLFSWLSCLIQGWYGEENLDAGNS